MEVVVAEADKNVPADPALPRNPLDPNILESLVVPVLERKRFNRDDCIAVGPIYLPVTDECQESIYFTSTIVDDFTTAEGETFACEMSAFVPNEEIEINCFIMWTNERTIGPEKPDADFASKCNWVFGFIKGVQEDKCMILIIGQLFIDESKPFTKTGHYILIKPGR